MLVASPDGYDPGAARSPAWDAVAVTPNDATDLVRVPAKALYVGVTGDVTVNTPGGGTQVLFKAAPVGVLPVRVTRVWSSGTTATNIVALY